MGTGDVPAAQLRRGAEEVDGLVGETGACCCGCHGRGCCPACRVLRDEGEVAAQAGHTAPIPGLYTQGRREPSG